jgi:FkbM family methyltransferase
MFSALRRRLRTYLENRLDVPTLARSLDMLVRREFQPAGIVDIGASRGDFARMCRARWPEARIACFEPLPERVTDLQAWARRVQGVQVFPTLLGEQVADAVPLHHADTASSVLMEADWPPESIHLHPMTTLDAVRQDLPTPHLIKLDVQGYELPVLKGGLRVLSEASVVITEVSLLDLQTNVPLVDDVTHWLAGQGWVMYDICGLLRRPIDGALWQMDVLYVPRDSRWRADKRWSA